MVTVIRGPFRSGKSSKILGFVRKALDAGQNPVLIVPSRLQRDIFIKELLGEKGFAGKVIFTLNELVQSVIASLNGKIAEISDFEAFILLKLIIEENRSRFSYFKDIESSGGLIKLIYSIVSELRAGGIKNGEEPFLKEFESSGNVHGAKWKDLLLIYSQFEKKLRDNNLYDSCRLLSRAAETVSMKNFQNPCLLAIDGFFDFTASQLDFVYSLVRCFEGQNFPVYITLPSAESPLLQKTLDDFKRHFDIQLEICKAAQDFGGDLFHPNPEKKADVSILQGFGKYREAERIANEIKKLILENNYRYNDIAVIFPASGEYNTILKSIFREFEIPFYSSQDESLRDNPVIIFLFSIIQKVLKEKAVDNIDILAVANSNYLVNTEYKILLRYFKDFPFLHKRR